MRYSKEHKLETHARIVQKASVRLREKGAHGVGVADLMKEAGLTHGGFYAHFASREQLLIEAFAYAMDRSTERWRKLAADTPREQRLALIVENYLSATHRDDPGRGCAVPALGAEIARESSKTRKVFAAKLDEMIDAIASEYVDASPKAARKQAMATLATMMGTLLLARIAGTGELSDTILQAGREAVLGRAEATKAPAKPAGTGRGVGKSADRSAAKAAGATKSKSKLAAQD
ncbi:TetR family transcriptional regulator [Rhodopseudomonas sp. AAP120]|uniref:TetR/AcrR family transcriptional regulator n=1 Tax=Rhodopseudomonas sp. AAP120 TaxID=1523430 RepID=UPI0006BA0704|nr:TetR/AcrR family transcriptional regulator [Rhodopseudomonas sp. AAP120]KPF90596.1 TetR family transcriptional regulator [Rhodopseudomonas sp. AAP120]